MDLPVKQPMRRINSATLPPQTHAAAQEAPAASVVRMHPVEIVSGQCRIIVVARARQLPAQHAAKKEMKGR